MSKISKTIKVISSILYIIIIFSVFLKNEQISNTYNLPAWIIPTIFYISILYICYKYIIFLIKKDELEEELISIVNHTFRTPLTSMMWYTKELEKNLPQNERLLYLQNINNATSKVLGVIDILTGIKNIQNTSDYYFEAISIREIVEKSIKKYREEVGKKSIVFQVSTFKDIPLLTLDLKKISFVIDSIIENSISYTKKDGRILIDCISDTKKLTLYISDTGIGLNWIDKLMIFSKFYRNKKAKLMNTDGMGLRLYLSKQIIKRHNGKIYAKSNGENEGTTFFIELPFRK
jgi:signal transduction histidine kinase